MTAAGARFRTVAVADMARRARASRRRIRRGHHRSEPRGDEGFGYDPVFVPDEGDGRTFAEMTSEDKHRLSHRGRAFRSLAGLLALK